MTFRTLGNEGLVLFPEGGFEKCRFPGNGGAEKNTHTKTHDTSTLFIDVRALPE